MPGAHLAPLSDVQLISASFLSMQQLSYDIGPVVPGIGCSGTCWCGLVSLFNLDITNAVQSWVYIH
jgi:hypothetical protein